MRLPGRFGARPNAVLAATILASSLGFIDGSVVNVGLRAIGQSLSSDAGALQWIVNAYLLPLSALLLLGGAAGDRYGRRRLLIAGTALFAFAARFVRFAEVRRAHAAHAVSVRRIGRPVCPCPYLLVESAHYSGTAAGAALLPLPLVLAVASPMMGSLAGRIGPRLPLSIGPLVVAAGFALATRIGPNTQYWTEVAPALLVMALGMSGAVAPLTTAVLSALDERHTGSTSGFNSAIARTGGLVAAALLGRC